MKRTMGSSCIYILDSEIFFFLALVLKINFWQFFLIAAIHFENFALKTCQHVCLHSEAVPFSSVLKCILAVS